MVFNERKDSLGQLFVVRDFAAGRSSGRAWSASIAVQFANDADRDGAGCHFSVSVGSSAANCDEFSAG